MFEWLYFKNEDNILVVAAPEHSKQMTSLLIMRTGGAAASTLAFLPENGGGFPPHPLPAWSSTLERFPVHPTWDSAVRLGGMALVPDEDDGSPPIWAARIRSSG